ncbi:MAG: hypothetical protein LBB54_02675 [Cellulomonadaceae bacterium]|nr:hypothetical protein [Cellulomonadaceae bacterium]
MVLGLAAAAVVKELSKPQDQRTWNGFVASVVPYDFRLPTLDKAKATYWNPDGAAVSPKLFGIGWDPNLGRIITDIKTLAGR